MFTYKYFNWFIPLRHLAASISSFEPLREGLWFNCPSSAKLNDESESYRLLDLIAGSLMSMIALSGELGISSFISEFYPSGSILIFQINLKLN